MDFEVHAEGLTWQDVKDYLSNDDRVIIPVGALEQHGPHLAMGTDTLTAMAVAQDAGRNRKVLVYPPLWYGWSQHHMAFAGTVSLRPETLERLVEDVVDSLFAHGFQRFLLLNGHRRGNLPPLQIAADRLAQKGDRVVAVADVGYLCFEYLDELRRSKPGGIGHAGEMETSHMLHLHPDWVRMDKAVLNPGKVGGKLQTKFLPSDPLGEGTSRFFMGRTPAGLKSSSGGLGLAGDPTVATAETGEKLHRAMVAGLEEVLDILARTKITPQGES